MRKKKHFKICLLIYESRSISRLDRRRITKQPHSDSLCTCFSKRNHFLPFICLLFSPPCVTCDFSCLSCKHCFERSIAKRTGNAAFYNVLTLSRNFTSHMRSFHMNAKTKRKQKIEKRDKNKSINLRCVRNWQKANGI